MPLHEHAVSELRLAIIRGTLRPGERLSEPELAQHFQTSRSPIREALVQLELEGFVERAKTGRICVRPLNLAEAEQLYVVRANLEGLATRLAAENITRKDTARLEANIEGMVEASLQRDFHRALLLGAEFHQTIIDVCGNKPLQDCLAGFRARTSRFRYILASIDEFSDRRINEHRAILAALQAQSPETAEQAMISHILVSSRDTLNALRSYLRKSESAASST